MPDARSPRLSKSRFVAGYHCHTLLWWAVHEPRTWLEDRDQLRQDLLAYCERDTWAMVRLVDRLRELARQA